MCFFLWVRHRAGSVEGEEGGAAPPGGGGECGARVVGAGGVSYRGRDWWASASVDCCPRNALPAQGQGGVRRCCGSSGGGDGCCWGGVVRRRELNPLGARRAVCERPAMAAACSAGAQSLGSRGGAEDRSHHN